MSNYRFPFLFFVFLFLIARPACGADLFGQVTDEYGKPLPFVSLYVLNSTQGTTSNAEGVYKLALEPGDLAVVFQYMGYQRQVISLKVDHRNILLNVAMQPEVLELKAVEVLADGIDPAVVVMRQAIKQRKIHLEEVEAYSCKMYLKGVQMIDERPGQVLGMNIPIDTGMVYLSESISEVNVQRPDQIKETVISSKLSGSQFTLSFNQGGKMLQSFYQNLLYFEGVSERGFVSPLASNAFLYYDYKLEGVAQEDDLLINKIRVIPKRENDPVFEGVIYIVEDLWRIQSVELTLSKGHQIEFVDQLTIRQRYTPINENIWMMFSQRYEFDVNAFGFKGAGYFVGIHTDYQIQSRNSDVKLFEDAFFDNELLSISLESKNQTNEYWDQIRPVPLSGLERKDYAVKDSLSVITESKEYKDSLDVKLNRFHLKRLLIGGYLHRKSYEQKYYRFQPVYNIIQYNTVEGLVVNLKSTMTKEDNGVWKYRVAPNLRYGFSSQKLYVKLRADYHFNAYKRRRIFVEGGRFISQFNNRLPVSPVVNTFETLARRANLAKLYEQRFGRIYYTSELANGIRFGVNMTYAERVELFNTAAHSLGWPANRTLTSNLPHSLWSSDLSFNRNQAFLLNFQLRVRFAQKYISRPNRKINLDSKYPTLNFLYRKGTRWFGSDVDFDVVSVKVNQSIDVGLWGTFDYLLDLGYYTRANKLFVMDYRHFNSSEALFTSFEKGSYLLLPSYLMSTKTSWFGIHVNHHFNGFILNKLPFVRKTQAQIVTSFHSLSTQEVPFFMELSLGLEHIFKFGRIEYVRRLSRDQEDIATHGVRLGIGF